MSDTDDAGLDRTRPEFLDGVNLPEEVPVSENSLDPHSPTAVVGPNILEAFAWFVGVLIVHAIGGFGGLFLISIWHVINTGMQPGQGAAADKFLKDVVQLYGFELVSMEMTFFVVVAVVATLCRLRPRPLAALSMQPIPTKLLVLIVTGAVPLAMASGCIHQWATEQWMALVKSLPGLDFFNFGDTNDMVKGLSESANTLTLLLAIAVAPAIGEEVIFRGVIGRGLTKRYGLIFGVCMSSVLFGLVHLHPAHALAVIPMGIFIHISYLATRSFWAPMLVHFLNNGFAVLLLELSDKLADTNFEPDKSMPTWVAVVCGALSVLTGVAMWRNRVTEDASMPSAPSSVESIERHSSDSFDSESMTDELVYRVAVGLGAMFLGVFVISLVGSMK